MVATSREYPIKFKWLEEGANKVKKKIEEVNKANEKSKKRVDDVAKSTRSLDTQQKKLNTTTSHSHGLMKKLEGDFTTFIKTGAIMAIGWQSITVGMQIAGQTIKDMMWKYSELEASMISIRAVTEATGRSYAEVMGLMTEHTDAFMTKTALAPGVMRLLSTSLDTKQIGQFIQAVKDGSAAMGYQADEQLPILARGFKQLTANILDNIGVTIYLDDIKKKAARTHNTVIEALTEEQIHLELLSEMVRQTDKYQGLYNKQMDTAKGSIASLTVEYTKLMEQISKGNVPVVREFVDALSDSIHGFGLFIQYMDDSKNKGLTFEESLMGIGNQMDVMVEGLAEYAIKNNEASVTTGILSDGINKIVELTGKYDKANKKSRAEIITLINTKIEDNKVTSDGNVIISESTKLLEKLSKEEEKRISDLESKSKAYQEVTDIQKENNKEVKRTIELIGGEENEFGLLDKAIFNMTNKIKTLDSVYNSFSVGLNATAKELEDARTKGGAEYIKFVEEHTEAITGLKYKYDVLGDSIKQTSKELSDSKSKLQILQKEYDSLNKVLYPDNVLNRVDRYKEVLKEVETANKNIIKTQEELREAELAVSESRVEPEIMARMIKDEETARINLYKAEVEADRKKKEEIALRGQLKGRLKEVADAMATEQTNYDTLNSKLTIYKSQQEDLSVQMKINREQRKLFNAELGIYVGLLKNEEESYNKLQKQKEQIEKDMVTEKSNVEDLARSYNSLAGSITYAVSARNAWTGYYTFPGTEEPMYVPGTEKGTRISEPIIDISQFFRGGQNIQQPSVPSNEYNINNINIYAPNDSTFTSITDELSSITGGT